MDLPYYHGPLSKKDCETLLLRDGADGNYLLRDSSISSSTPTGSSGRDLGSITYRQQKVPESRSFPTSRNWSLNLRNPTRDWCVPFSSPSRGPTPACGGEGPSWSWMRTAAVAVAASVTAVTMWKFCPEAELECLLSQSGIANCNETLPAWVVPDGLPISLREKPTCVPTFHGQPETSGPDLHLCLGMRQRSLGEGPFTPDTQSRHQLWGTF